MEPLNAERRIVTVLFADLVGFTSLSERLDVEDVATLQEAYFSVVRDTVGRHGGRVEKFIGDAAMAVFGIQRTREDDAERAVRAGLALGAAVEALGARLGLEAGELRLRVGIDTGDVVHQANQDGEWRVTGDTVNVAARLQAAAPPSGVLLGEETALAVAASVELAEPEALSLKGKAEPVRAARVRRIRPQRSRERAMGRLRAPMVGREDDMAWVRDAMGRTARGASGCLLVIGPPGVGKTRFTMEATADASRTASVDQVLVARALPEAGPYDVMRDLLRGALGDDGPPGAGGRVVEDRLAGSGTLSPARARLVADALAELLDGRGAQRDASGVEDDEARIAAWLDGFDALAQGRTVVWLIEDLHWAGPDTIRALGEAGRRAPRGRGRRIVLATTRPSAVERISDSSEAWMQAAQRELRPLEAAGTAGLVRALVGGAVPDRLVGEIAERSDGNPLFIEEVLRSWISSGILEPAGDDGWALTLPPAAVGVPATIQAVYAAQIDDLSAQSREVVRRASVCGRAFPSGALPAVGVPEPMLALDALLAGGVVSGPQPASIVGDEYAYRHALLRDAGYASLTRSDRAGLHVRVARWLEEVAGRKADEVADVIGRHYAAALRALPALAATIDDGLTRVDTARIAAGWLERAGHHAVRIGAVRAAASAFSESVALTTDDEPLLRARRLLGLGETTGAAADMDEAITYLQAAIDIYREVRASSPGEAERIEARAGLSHAAAELGRMWLEQVRFRDAADLLQGIIEELRDDRTTMDIPLARVWMGWARTEYEDTSRDTTPEIQAVLETARRAGDRSLELEAMLGAELIARELGRPSASAPAELEALAREVGDWSVLQDELRFKAQLLSDDHPREALPLLDEAAAVAEAHGLTEGLGWTEYARAEALCVIGDLDGVEAACERALALAGQNAYRRIIVRTNHVLVPVAMARGDRGPARELEAFYRSMVGAFPDSWYARIMRAAMDLHIADAGAGPPSVPEVEPRLASFDAPGGGASWLLAVERVIDRWLEVGEIAGAREAIRRMDMIRDHPDETRLARGVIDLLAARLALVDGDPASAETRGRAALEAFRSISATWWVWKSVRALDAAGAASEAERSEAVRLADQLGLRP